MAAMATLNAILKNVRIPIKSIISQLLRTIDYSLWYHIKARYAFYPMVIYTNYLIAYSGILMKTFGTTLKLDMPFILWLYIQII